METATDVASEAPAVVEDIFAKDTWTRQDCKELYTALFQVNKGAEKFRATANKLLAENDEPAGAAAVKAGIIQYMLGDFAEAAATLAAGTDNADRRWYQAQAYRRVDQFDKAAEQFALAAARGWDEGEAKALAAQCQCLGGNIADAEKALKDLKAHSELAEYQVLLGMVAEATGQYEQAEEAYGQALDVDNDNISAMFHLAFLYDMHGDEEQAIDLYAQCLRTPPINANAAINLAVLYEDLGKWDEAQMCLDMILSIQPNHPRAKLFAKDVEGSRSMYYDEDLERRAVQRNAVLDIPVTDFELSVRARNCLKKMDINTLGDLMRVTEADLLGSKNFGETSLIEIKTMLAQKGLTLGQDVNPAPAPALPTLETADGEAGDGLGGKLVAELELSVRARKALERLGIMTLGDLTSRTESELLTCKNFGQTSLNEIKQRLAEHGLSLRGR